MLVYSNICIFHLSSFQDPISSLSLSTPTTNSAARVPINLLPPPAPCQLRGCHEHTDIFPRAPPPLGAVSVLFLARRLRPLQTSSVVNIDQLLAEAAHDPRELCPDMRDGITVTHYITETDYLTTEKSFVFPPLFSSQHKAYSLR